MDREHDEYDRAEYDLPHRVGSQIPLFEALLVCSR
jgi:hypothetical protein